MDCALRIGPLGDSRPVARRLGAVRLVVCASPGTLAERGTPTDLSALADHDCIGGTGLGPRSTWTMTVHRGGRSAERQVPVHVRLATTTPESALRAAIDGPGLVQATSYQAAPHVAAGLLVPVLAAHDGPPIPVSLVTPGSRLAPLELRALLDFATPRLVRRLADVEKAMARR